MAAVLVAWARPVALVFKAASRDLFCGPPAVAGGHLADQLCSQGVAEPVIHRVGETNPRQVRRIPVVVVVLDGGTTWSAARVVAGFYTFAIHSYCESYG
jgi:hypothetical protein